MMWWLYNNFLQGNKKHVTLCQFKKLQQWVIWSGSQLKKDELTYEVFPQFYLISALEHECLPWEQTGPNTDLR